jgi:hypothetical protein
VHSLAFFVCLACFSCLLMDACSLFFEMNRSLFTGQALQVHATNANYIKHRASFLAQLLHIPVCALPLRCFSLLASVPTQSWSSGTKHMYPEVSVELKEAVHVRPDNRIAYVRKCSDDNKLLYMSICSSKLITPHFVQRYDGRVNTNVE